MTIRAVIFDRDGVLANFDEPKAASHFEQLLPNISIYDIYNYWEKWGKSVGFPQTVNEEVIFLKNFWEDFCNKFNVPPDKRAQFLKVNYFDFMFAYPEARTVLLEIRKQGLKIGVLSNFTLASLEGSLTALNLMDLIDVAYTAVSMGVSKPHQQAYLNIVSALGLKPEECLFFDDELENVKGAQECGMHAYLVKRDQSFNALDQHIICDLNLIPQICDQYIRKEK